MGTAPGHPADPCCSRTPPGSAPGPPDDPRTPSRPPRGRPLSGPFSMAPLAPSRGASCAAPGSPQVGGPRSQLPAAPAVAGTPAAVAAATASLTPIAEQGGRSSHGRSHVCAARKHSRGSLGPGPGFLPRWRDRVSARKAPGCWHYHPRPYLA